MAWWIRISAWLCSSVFLNRRYASGPCDMCRSCADGGRRCPASARATARHNGRRRAFRLIHRLSAAGIGAGLAAEMPTEYWWDAGEKYRLEPARARAIRDPQRDLWKPEGGLWSAPRLGRVPVSPAAEGFHTTWTDFEACDEAGTGTLTELEPADTAVVVRLTTPADVQCACARWPHAIEVDAAIGYPRIVTGFSFEAMRTEGVDAVHVDGSALGTPLLFGWDVESSVWLNPGKAAAGRRIPVAWPVVDR
jgi:hypothetical protein